jgi:ribonucleoside-diphosphate reductase alpha subunit
MRVHNRSGESVEVSYDKIKERIQQLCSRGSGERRADDGLNNDTNYGENDNDKTDDYGENSHGQVDMSSIDIDEVVIETIKGLYDGITTAQLDDMSARVCVSLQSNDHAYDTLAGRICMSNIHKTIGCVMSLPHDTYAPFSAKVSYIGRKMPGTYNSAFFSFVEKYGKNIDAMMDYEMDYNYNYFSVRTMEKGYLMRVDDVCIESPQDMWMRVAVAINCRGVEDGGSTEEDTLLRRVKTCYDGMSRGRFTHATPTLFNAGTCFEQLSSCYLLGTEDSLKGIYETLSDCAQISKWAGGIGVHVSNVRSKGSHISTTNGSSDGIVTMLKVFNETARYCNQSGRRKGSIAIYLEPWHADVWEFAELRRNTGAETERTRDLFLALWVPDLFMRRVEEDGEWFLMSPDSSPGLQDVHGKDFDRLYEEYVSSGRFVRKVRAKDLWHHIIQCQMETGTPYVLFKDNVNAMCNQKNLGTIKSSNLCAEITEFSDSSTYAVCNLASIAVNRFVKGKWRPLPYSGEDDIVHNDKIKVSRRPGVSYDFEALHETAKLITYNLNKIIDINYYPTPQTHKSNTDARPIGIGVQGFADLYCALGLTYEDEEALQMDAEVMETIYHGALEASIELARKDGPYPRFEGSPFSKGQLQMDLWTEWVSKQNGKMPRPVRYSRNKRWDWDAVREGAKKYGTRNSMVTALMPTATTSQILGNAEAFEPFHSNVFKRTTLAGEFLVLNKTLMRDMLDAGVWEGSNTMQQLMRDDGSVQKMESVPDHIKRLYKTVWEIPQKSILDHAMARAPFVDQSQSMNLFFATPNSSKLYSALLYAWKGGLKTGMYYLRSQPSTEALKISGGGGGSSTSSSTNTKKQRLQQQREKRSGAQQQNSAGTNATTATTSTAAPPNRTCSWDNGVCEMCSS